MIAGGCSTLTPQLLCPPFSSSQPAPGMGDGEVRTRWSPRGCRYLVKSQALAPEPPGLPRLCRLSSSDLRLHSPPWSRGDNQSLTQMRGRAQSTCHKAWCTVSAPQILAIDINARVEVLSQAFCRETLQPCPLAGGWRGTPSHAGPLLPSLLTALALTGPT